MSGINKVILIGNLGAAPEINTMSNGEMVANLSLATSETWIDRKTGEKREEVEWHRCVAYRRLAEILGQYCHKGSRIYVEGRLKTRKWQDKEGQTRYTTEVKVSVIQLLGDGHKSNSEGNHIGNITGSKIGSIQQGQGNVTQKSNTSPEVSSEGEDTFADSDIPF